MSEVLAPGLERFWRPAKVLAEADKCVSTAVRIEIRKSGTQEPSHNIPLSWSWKMSITGTTRKFLRYEMDRYLSSCGQERQKEQRLADVAYKLEVAKALGKGRWRSLCHDPLRFAPILSKLASF